MPKIILPVNNIQKRNYHQVNLNDPNMVKYTGKVSHPIIKVGEDDKSEVGVLISRKFNKAEFNESNRQLKKIDHKNWYKGKNQDTDYIDLEQVVVECKNDDNNEKRLLEGSKAGGTLIRLHYDSTIIAPEEDQFSDKTIAKIQEAVEKRSPQIDVVFDPKTGKYEDTNIDYKPQGYYKPNYIIKQDLPIIKKEEDQWPPNNIIE